MPSTNTIQQLHTFIRSSQNNTVLFEKEWEYYRLKKKYFAELVAAACQYNRSDILDVLLAESSLLPLLNGPVRIIGNVQLNPIQHAFFYAQLDCVRYIHAHYPQIMQPYLNVDTYQKIVEGLNDFRKKEAFFLKFRSEENFHKNAYAYYELMVFLIHTLIANPSNAAEEVNILIPFSFHPSEFELIIRMMQLLPAGFTLAFVIDAKKETALSITHQSMIMEEQSYVVKLPLQASAEFRNTPFEPIVRWYETTHPTPQVLPVPAPPLVKIPFDDILSWFNQDQLDNLIHVLNELENNRCVIEHTDKDINTLASLFISSWKIGQWVNKDNGNIQDIYSNRDEVLQNQSSENINKLNLIDRLFQHLDLKLFTHLSENQRLHPLKVQRWYYEKVTAIGAHFAHDPSDDSDSEDERNPSPQRKHKQDEIKALQKHSFWKRTRRTHLTTQAGKPAAALEEALKRETIKRATLPSSDETKPQFVATFRGVNYLGDRWRNPEKRAHYQEDEVGKPYYSEAALIAGRNFYVGIDSTSQSAVDETAQKIQAAHLAFGETGPCIGKTTKPAHDTFIFNSFREFLQHHYSNGISEHLKQLVGFLKDKDSWLGQHFSNAYNYAISTGDRPYHSLRYALGLKNYYHNPFTPYYNQDGSIQNFHAGKLYVFMFTHAQMQDINFVNRVNSLLQNGRCPVLRDISSEVETTLFGKVDAEQVVYQFELRFPSFNKPYKEVYEVKYGMDRALYQLFQTLLTETPLSYNDQGVSSREPIIELLKEWLCAYYEVVAIDTAQRIAQQKGGDLIYYNERDELSLVPTQRPLTNGKNHIEPRRQMHVLEHTRKYLAQKITGSHPLRSNCEIQFPAIDLQREVTVLIESPAELETLLKTIPLSKIQLTQAEEAWVAASLAARSSQTDAISHELRLAIVKTILQTYLHTFATPVIHHPGNTGFFAWTPPTVPSFKNMEALAKEYCNEGSSDGMVLG